MNERPADEDQVRNRSHNLKQKRMLDFIRISFSVCIAINGKLLPVVIRCQQRVEFVEVEKAVLTKFKKSIFF
jgi:hypothetical protein